MAGLNNGEIPRQEVIVRGQDVSFLTQDCSLGSFILEKLNKFADKTGQVCIKNVS